MGQLPASSTELVRQLQVRERWAKIVGVPHPAETAGAAGEGAEQQAHEQQQQLVQQQEEPEGAAAGSSANTKQQHEAPGVSQALFCCSWLLHLAVVPVDAHCCGRCICGVEAVPVGWKLARVVCCPFKSKLTIWRWLYDLFSLFKTYLAVSRWIRLL